MSHLRRIALLVGLLAALWVGGPSSRALAANAAADPGVWEAAGVSRLRERAPAPPVVLDDLRGQKVDLQDFRGQLVMLYFWATW
jgi:hypothetical protein